MDRKVLVLTRSWYGTGGMERYTRDYWESLLHVRQKVFLCCPSSPLGVTLLLLPVQFLFSLLIHRPQIVHATDASLCWLLWLAKLCGCKTVVTCHGLDVLWKPKWYQAMVRWLLPKMDRIICVSSATKNVVLQRGVEEEKTVVIPNALHVEDIPTYPAQNRDTLCLLSVGRLVERKGFAWFVANVIEKLSKTHPNLEYHLVGDGPQREEIEKIVEEKSLSHVVHMHGRVDDNSLEDLYKKSDVFVVPNISVDGDMEGFGIVCIEASARGIPVAAARLEGLYDAVREGETGQFFESESVESCIEAINQSRELSRTVCSTVTREHYAWNSSIKKYASLFSSV